MIDKQKSIRFLGIALLTMAVISACTKSPKDSLVQGDIWRDTNGNIINAHGGGILYFDSTYYWYGEFKGDSSYLLDGVKNWECWRADAGGVSCYSSKDLIHWKFEKIVLPVTPDDTASELHPSQVIERPKVIFNESTGMFVMWMHIESPDYQKAHAGIAISKNPDGIFTYLGSVKPNGNDSRDQTLFKDDDGRAYQIASSEWNKTIQISLLSYDYTTTSGRYILALNNLSREAPAVFKCNGKYYMITSGCTGWDPNTAGYAMADSMLGTWTQKGNPCTGIDADLTFRAQSTYVFPVTGKSNQFVAMFDRWNKSDLDDSRYVWLPVEISDNRIEIAWKDRWIPAAMNIE
jgi:beta-galactosidase